jgi:hypothetical protein
MENVNTLMTAIPKGTATAKIKAEMEQIIEEEGLEEYVRVYTNGSLTEKSRIDCQNNAEAVAILEAIKTTRRWGLPKKLS